MTASDTLSRGRRSFQRRAWGECHSSLADADRETPLTGDDLELYATVAYLIGRMTESVDLWTRAHGQYLAAGNVTRAARCAVRVGIDLLSAGERVRGAGWVDKARRLLDEKKRTTDVTPPPHITPCGMGAHAPPGRRLEAATRG